MSSMTFFDSNEIHIGWQWGLKVMNGKVSLFVLITVERDMRRYLKGVV